MHLAETPGQQALRAELRAYFAALDVGGQPPRDVVRKLGADGWLGIGWPAEYGGQGRSVDDQYVFFDEVQRAAVPFPFVTINTVGPALMRHGSDDQRRRFLPGILAGEIVFAIGYTEPQAGTDLASLTTRARRDGDEWVVDGRKVFTSGADTADHVWLACRTDPDLPRHRGISILIVSTADPGFSWTPITTVGGAVTTATYYDGVRVPAADLVGEPNGGWKLITTQLNHERIGLGALGGRAERLWDEVLAWARAGGRLEEPWVQRDLAWCHARLEAMRLLNWKMTAAVGAGELQPADASSAKVYGTETQLDVYRALLGVLGPAGRLRPGSPGAALHGAVEQAARAAVVNTFGGGVNEVLRDMIAVQGLGLPRPGRTGRNP